MGRCGQGIRLWKTILPGESPVPGSSTEETCSYHASVGHKGMILTVTFCLLLTWKDCQGHPAQPTEPTGVQVGLYYNFGTLAKAPGKELYGKLLPIGHSLLQCVFLLL